MSGNSDISTKQALLLAAVRVFASKGFRAATVREICQLANANVAAVNYHFGSKDALYAAVLDHTFDLEKTEALRERFGVASDAPIEERIGAYIRTHIHEIYADEGWSGVASDHWAIFLMEMASPSPHLDSLVHEHIQGYAGDLRQLVSEYLGVEPNHRMVLDSSISIWAQLFDPLVMMPITDRFRPPRPRVQEYLDEFADHVVAFTLGGLKALKETI
ncbi:TetR/AcrR family transcriptional regulator [Desulfovibrio oxyclinae]|uniref:TetR/AcrR family transcriptional regulator n=1 Tax=Desulfovibrio oxyclinae TaxID=63560 RepID=UPI00036C69BA|nr:CerR family C-terminal domain-containing protein [Desulfovibrio oxyclinae]